MPALLVDVAMRIVVPITSLPGPEGGRAVRGHLRLGGPRAHPGDLSADLGAGRAPDTTEGIARVVIDFAVQFLTEDHEDVADVLRQLEAVGVGQALDAHPAPAGAHPVRLAIV
ncbi:MULTISPECIES: hypothetical protein [Streptomyces]|uniref:hypothetical protein n=1 Tax=Streptomyces TaxID=1883 RepID=UPI00345BA779